MSYLSIASWVNDDATASAVEFTNLDTTDATSLRFEMELCCNTSTSQGWIPLPLKVQHAWAGGPNASAASEHWGGSMTLGANNGNEYKANCSAGGSDFYLLQIGKNAFNRAPADGANPTSGSGAPNGIYRGYCMQPNGTQPKNVIWEFGWMGKDHNVSSLSGAPSSVSKIGQGVGGIRQNDAATEANAVFNGIRFSLPSDAFTIGSRINISKMT